MKKLLVLMMVLGLATSAQAAISLSLNGNPAPAELTLNISDVVTIDVESDDDSTYGAYLEMQDSENLGLAGIVATRGEWYSDMTIYTEAGSDAYASPDPYGYLGTWELSASGTPTGTLTSPGTHFAIDFHCKGEGDVTIALYDLSWLVPLQTLVIHQVPEPMTIGLLGLGGLLLRRRK
jgi:hypothetical protein